MEMLKAYRKLRRTCHQLPHRSLFQARDEVPEEHPARSNAIAAVYYERCNCSMLPTLPRVWYPEWIQRVTPTMDFLTKICRGIEVRFQPGPYTIPETRVIINQENVENKAGAHMFFFLIFYC